MKDHSQEWSRRDFLRIGAAAGAGASLAGSPASAQSLFDRKDDHAPDDFNEATIAQLQATTAHQQEQIEALTAGLQKVSAQLELGKAVLQTVRNNQ